MKKFKKTTVKEFNSIKQLQSAGLTPGQVATLVKRAPSTIYNMFMVDTHTEYKQANIDRHMRQMQQKIQNPASIEGAPVTQEPNDIASALSRIEHEIMAIMKILTSR